VVVLTAAAPKRVAALGLMMLAGLAGGLAPAAAMSTSIGQQVRADDMAALRAIDVPAAWPRSRGRRVTVAVLDTGVSPGAPDLAGAVTTGPDYTAGADPAGYRPPHLHGTYIASIIAGRGSGPGRAGGMLGVAPQARILSVRVILDDQEPGFAVYQENAGYDGAIAAGIRYAVRHGAGVINASFGGTEPTRSVRLAVGYAIAHGVVLVAAAGNDGSTGDGFTPYSYPASFTGVIAVAAASQGGRRASFSDRNSAVVVCAPGVRVAGDGPGGSFVSGSGTSPASAFVAGVAALIRSKYPRLSPGLVTQAIVTSARRRPPGGYSPSTGFGEVDAAAALAAAGRLAAGRPTSGMNASAHFGGGAAAPLVVMRHDTARAALLAAVAIAAALGFLGVIAALAIRARRGGRPPPLAAPPAAAVPPATVPAGGSPVSPPMPQHRTEESDEQS
jgi:subtilisin family serine protease